MADDLEWAETLGKSAGQVNRTIKRLRAREAALMAALKSISGLKPAQDAGGRTNWVQTCGEMRIIAAKAILGTAPQTPVEPR